MKLRQIVLLCEVVKQNFNLSTTAAVLYTSQPGISKALIDLEKELEVAIFNRQGKRLIGLSSAGLTIHSFAKNILLEVENIKKVSDEFKYEKYNKKINTKQVTGRLTIAATHTQARYTLPSAVNRFQKEFPNISLSIIQGSPEQIAGWVNSQTADVAIATEFISDDKSLITLPIYEWQHLLIGRADNNIFAKILSKDKIAIKDLSNVPLITYEKNFAGRQKINEVFNKENITPNIVLQAMDSDVIKTYVNIGMGLGIVAEVAISSSSSSNIIAKPLGHIFGKSTTSLGLKKGSYQKQYVREFIKILCPKYTDSDLQII